jgi:hypothetical protein
MRTDCAACFATRYFQTLEILAGLNVIVRQSFPQHGNHKLIVRIGVRVDTHVAPQQPWFISDNVLVMISLFVTVKAPF